MNEPYQPPANQAPVLHLERVMRVYTQGPRQVNVLNGATATIHPGEAVALVGPSGAGKSTLLHIAGLLETPDTGRVFIDGQDCTHMLDGARTRVRRRRLGFIYQFHQLLPEFSAIENVAIPLMIAGVSKRSAKERAGQLLISMGLEHRLRHRPPELSGGEQQRTAICRALANSPRLILADEPTGNLDPKTSARVFDAFMSLIRQTGVSALIATHDMALASRMDRVLQMADGHLEELHPADLTPSHHSKPA